MGFIKGPVCRGQIALSVIEDHFWVVFVDPDNKVMNEDAHFYDRESDNLRLPSSEGSEALLLTPWLRYSALENKYLAAKGAYMKKALTRPADITLDIVWDGDGENTNAALTVFRHFDSATVLKGFVGDVPKTAWLIEYPLLERIHYLLVAGFDVYGNAGHQLNSRLYMDFLRMEGEFNFLTLLPKDVRVPERDFWYRGARQSVKEYIYGKRISFDVDSGIPFESGDPKAELFELLRRHLGPALMESRYEATNRMIEHAQSLGANAVVNVRYATSSVAAGAAELYVYGTAVVLESDQPAPQPPPLPSAKEEE